MRVTGQGSLLRQRILDAARRELPTRSLDELRIKDLLDASGVSRRTFHRHFGTKRGVVEALTEQHMRDLVERLEERVRGSDDPVGEWLRIYVLWRRDSGDLGVALSRESRLDPVLQAMRRDAMTQAGRILEASRKERGGPPVDPIVYRGLIGALEEVGHDLRHAPEDPMPLIRLAARKIMQLFALVPQAEVDARRSKSA